MKYLIEVSVPASGLVHDLFVPDTMQVGTLTLLSANVFAQLSGGLYVASESAILCEKKTGCVFDADKRIRDTAIRNGTRLVLY